MPSVWMRCSETNNILELLLEGETLVYETGEMVSRENNQWIIQADESMPNGYHTIISSKPLFDSEDPPNIIDYHVHAIRTEIVNKRRGGYTIKSSQDGILSVEIISTQTMLETLDTRLKAINTRYGIRDDDTIQPDR